MAVPGTIEEGALNEATTSWSYDLVQSIFCRELMLAFGRRFHEQ